MHQGWVAPREMHQPDSGAIGATPPLVHLNIGAVLCLEVLFLMDFQMLRLQTPLRKSSRVKLGEWTNVSEELRRFK